MHHPTVGGKVYAASTYGLQMALAAGGLVVFGGIAYTLFGNVAKKTGPTRMFGTAMDRLNKHPQVASRSRPFPRRRGVLPTQPL